ncbi:hypothetical protein ABFS82_08G060200 [Erythranthe guttata]|uniref:BSD domain-containing protein n=1 Tax=Erythranthe guttata TaxID=4155 RepID=A0A022RX34_ERYGU|nr:PREDICTED: synapse-associated protein of 47 kDa [Erythranthe guttata]EYU44516.1 hypothetical protein MIMGU_mgv1a006250mg [Erythranthe guttata]|eukprot:XP_012854114.1 PREDICTED: synapse-associated protein of 47 kDa [Erythranthe guttata]
MSWLARSIANSLKFDDDDDVSAGQKPEIKHPENPDSGDDEATSPTSPSRGVKEDLSELSKTLTRQFWGVASFLAPPPQPDQKSGPELAESDQDPASGIRGDFAEIGGKFRSGISRLSNNINVSEITKLASNFLQLESDDENEEAAKEKGFDSSGNGAVGVTEEVLAFVRDVAMHPETWLDFPLPENDEEIDFDMSDAQQEHALAVERFAPELSALRIELCPEYMSESNFWKIYFVLLHPRLDKEDAVLLSTPQIMEARALLAYELKNRNTPKTEDFSGKKSSDPEENTTSHNEEPLSVPSPVLSKREDTTASTEQPNTEIAKQSVETSEIQITDKSVVEEKGDVDQVKDQPRFLNVSGEKDEEDDADDWLKEETSEIDGAAGSGNSIPIENDDDVSFSDLEEDDNDDVRTSFRKSNYSSDKDSRDWVRLGKGSSGDLSSKEVDGDDIVVS